MSKEVSRRKVLAGLGGGAALLFHKQIAAAAGPRAAGVGAPGGLDMSLTAITKGALRISIAPVASATPAWELGIIDRPGLAPLEKPGVAHAHEVQWGDYTIKVDENPVRLTVSDRSGRVRQVVGFDTNSVTVRFKIGSAPLFGLGEGGYPFDRRGVRDPLLNGQSSNTKLETYGARLPIPWIISAEGWGLFIGQPSGTLDLSGAEGTFRAVEATSTRNVFLVLGDTPADLLREYAKLTGFPHMPPLWSLGFLQSHRTLISKEAVLAEADTFREKKLPCDAMIYLGTGFCPSGWNTGAGSFTFNEKIFPDPAAMIQQLHRNHFKVVVHIVPPGDFHGFVGDTGVAAEEPGDASTYWAKHIPVDRAGVDGWWPDEGDRLSTYSRAERNRMYWEGSVKLHPDRRPFALHRNGYAGLQRFGWLWSGDIDSTWATLRAQIMTGINVGLSGIPYWGTDIGGFVATKELTPELYVRWFQFAAFCPLFRAHGRAWQLRLPWGWNLGTAGPKEMQGEWVETWPPKADMHRADVEEICRKYLNLRYQLLPYLYSMVAETHATGVPLMRALWIGYPTDAKATMTDDQYLWGDCFLVAPVYEKDAAQRKTYLPAGAWWDYWTGERTEGGKEVTRGVDLATMPLYVKAGSIIPVGPVKQHTAEESTEPITLRIYPGADGKFDWYDDDGSSFLYQRGDYMKVACVWRDSERVLTLTRDAKGRLGAGRKVHILVQGETQGKDATLGAGVTEIKL